MPTAKSLVSTRDTNNDFLPESTDTSYLNKFYHFLRNGERWQMNNNKVCGQLTSQMESTIQIRYQETSVPKRPGRPPTGLQICSPAR
jgi:hypothetical protein